ncbi:MAG: phosphoenolpyruvate--protein phosphotransferase [Oscillospiraceae bacterium]|jgi:phosphotransferase system enzyme I (PtsI)|nr:phosphoenolpyruvate--protein phosphotransferase [Oscillospiraceae bacterium]
MNVFKGKSICKKVAIGTLAVLKPEEPVRKQTVSDTKAEITRFYSARDLAIEKLRVLQQKVRRQAGEEEAGIFEIHAMMLEDDDFCDSVLDTIESQNANTEYAVWQTGEDMAEAFRLMNDEYFSARAADIKDIAAQVIDILQGKDKSGMTDGPVILAAQDLKPSEALLMDPDMLLGIVTERSSTNSHTAILARTMGIPAVTGVDFSKICSMSGRLVILDGNNAELITDPAEAVIEKYTAEIETQLESERQMMLLKGSENITQSGRKIELFANAGSVDDVQLALQNDAGGIGLFRSEFLYIGRTNLPSEDEQFEVYRTVLETMKGRRVIVRTMDIGADKKADYLKLEREENPAMGYRAIRICLDRRDIFKTQLRALYRASVFGNLSIMYPMITSVWEIAEIKKITAEVRAQLATEKIAFSENVSQGIMIETPAAALISDLLAPMVDFFSIGTNDLTQYTLAVDRQNVRLEAFGDPHHEAVMRLIALTVQNAHKAGIWVGICGELAADETLTQRFLDMDIDELSVSPKSVLSVRYAIQTAR